MSFPVLPESAPFSTAQRAWLSGFLAGMFAAPQQVGAEAGAAAPAAPPPARQEEELPWHDPALDLSQRLKLADGRPRPMVLMAAMAQLDCGACGYLCRTYARAIDRGEETDLTRCAPGGAETAKRLKQIMTEMPGGAQEPDDVVVHQPVKPAPAASAAAYDRKHPFPARMLENRALNAPGSAKDTRHVVLDLNDSGLTYEPGDALGVYAENSAEVVESILELLGASGAEDVVAPGGAAMSFREALLRECLVTRPSRKMVELLAKRASHWSDIRALQHMADDGEVPEGCQIVDLLNDYQSARPEPWEFVAGLSPLQPRLYSIASSPRVHPGQVHLTVGVVRYVNNYGTKCEGVASTYLAERVRPGQKVRVFVQPSHRFRLPADGGAAVIMVGAGTGIAPFRAFLQDRKHTGAAGENWLIFGDRHEKLDFLYRDELLDLVKDGVLSRLDTAFSRDQSEKLYVQHRMLEHAQGLWERIKAGAVFYVCGDAKRMANDVDTALRRIVSEQGKMPWPEAEAFVDAMASEKRYQRDVY
jgi:sulfite reductase (NADPH) flavoprotein alpha-component